MLTFSDLASLYRREGQSNTLGELPKDFHIQVEELLANPELGDYEREVRDMYEKILSARIGKILEYCRGPMPEKRMKNSLEKEEELKNRVNEAVKKFMESGAAKKPEKAVMRQSEPAMGGDGRTQEEKTKKQESEKGGNSGHVKVKLLQEINDFVGVDGKTYGPYKKGQQDEMPVENARILEKQGFLELE